jgi:hypothetical protein
MSFVNEAIREPGAKWKSAPAAPEIRRGRGRPRGSRARKQARGNRSTKSAPDGGDGDPDPDSEPSKCRTIILSPEKKAALSLQEFCALYDISAGTLFKLRKSGRGPTVTQIGEKRIVVLREDADEWARRFRLLTDPISNNLNERSG